MDDDKYQHLLKLIKRLENKVDTLIRRSDQFEYYPMEIYSDNKSPLLNYMKSKFEPFKGDSK